MLVDPKSPKKHDKRCEKCSCPLYLLKVEKWKWESRRYCQRCLSPKSMPSMLDRAIDAASQSGNMRAALREVSIAEVARPKQKKIVDRLH
jgi:hypothetical protein